MKKYIVAAVAILIAITCTEIVLAASASYKTKSGDTWESVAAQYGITVQQLADLNQPKAGTKLNVPSSTVVTPPPTSTPPTGSTELLAYLTSYAAGDNSPPGIGTWIDGVSGSAGGSGTYANPITLAVGYVGNVADFAPGTLFYVPNVERYFIAEDTCAACHETPKGVQVWLDLYAGDYSGNSVDACEDKVTGDYDVIENPASDYPVVSGSLYNGSQCTALYGNTI